MHSNRTDIGNRVPAVTICAIKCRYECILSGKLNLLKSVCFFFFQRASKFSAIARTKKVTEKFNWISIIEFNAKLRGYRLLILSFKMLYLHIWKWIEMGKGYWKMNVAASLTMRDRNGNVGNNHYAVDSSEESAREWKLFVICYQCR